MVSWRRLSGVTGIAAAAIAAGAGAVVVAEKIAVGRIRLRPDPAADEPFGEIRGEVMTVTADDGLPLHVEVSGPTTPANATSTPVTIIFCHGYTLNSDVWYYQRAGLERSARLVFWDQRSHGRSGRSDPELVSIDQLGADLHEVLVATAPGDMPVVLVGHSMGGMTVMALADQHPELIGSKVIGAVLISTAAGTVDPVTWLPALLRPAVRVAMPSMMTGASRGRMAEMVERGHQGHTDRRHRRLLRRAGRAREAARAPGARQHSGGRADRRPGPAGRPRPVRSGRVGDPRLEADQDPRCRPCGHTRTARGGQRGDRGPGDTGAGNPRGQ